MTKILIIGFVWPEPKSSAAGSRMMQLIETFSAEDSRVIFTSPSSRGDQAVNLEALGIESRSIPLNDSEFDVFVKDFQPDLVIFDRFMIEEQFGWRVSENCPNAIKILDTEDLHCLRKGRQQAYKDKMAFSDVYLFNVLAKREIASIYRCDLSLMISEVEIEILTKKFKVPASLLLYLPFMLTPISEAEIKALPHFNERSHFVTIGNFLHEPNYQSVLYLKQTLWPLIKQELPKAKIYVYGAYASQKVNQLNNPKDGFLVKGFAEDVNEVMKQARICLAALVFGAGLKGKLVDAMKNGTPCGMSTIAAEGMFGAFPPNGIIEDKPEPYAKKIAAVYNDERLWKEKQNSGFEVYNGRFNKSHFQTVLKNRVAELQKHLKTHRLHNFTGAMLLHHSMQSTKFMSRWIEEKNKQL